MRVYVRVCMVVVESTKKLENKWKCFLILDELISLKSDLMKIDCSCLANCDDSNFFVQAYVNTIYMLNMFAFVSEYMASTFSAFTVLCTRLPIYFEISYIYI